MGGTARAHGCGFVWRVKIVLLRPLLQAKVGDESWLFTHGYSFAKGGENRFAVYRSWTRLRGNICMCACACVCVRRRGVGGYDGQGRNVNVEIKVTAPQEEKIWLGFLSTRKDCMVVFSSSLSSHGREGGSCELRTKAMLRVQWKSSAQGDARGTG